MKLDDKRRFGTALIALILAFGSGFLMQNVLHQPSLVTEKKSFERDLPKSPDLLLTDLRFPSPNAQERTLEQAGIWRGSYW